jgi:hypothetical protein
MIRWFRILLETLGSIVRTHRELALENLALRQQLAVWKARQPRPRWTGTDRIFWVLLSRLWKNWRTSLQVVRPETVVRWHRHGFRGYWAWKSRRRRRASMSLVDARPQAARQEASLCRTCCCSQPYHRRRKSSPTLPRRVQPVAADDAPPIDTHQSPDESVVGAYFWPIERTL